MLRLARIVLVAWLVALTPLLAGAETAGSASADPLHVVQDGQARMIVVISASAGEAEKLAAADLLKYVELMTGARLPVVTVPAGSRAPAGPAIVIGQAALEEERGLAARLAAVTKKTPLLGADAIVMRRVGPRLYLAGNNDRAHAYAVSQLLQDWGCRWYLPTEFGEAVPEHRDLKVGTLDRAYGSPFEIRDYWLSWLGDNTGKEDFARRNFSTVRTLPGAGHALGQYIKALVPPGGKSFHVPLSELETAAEVASQIDAEYAKGVPGISLAIEDNIHQSASESDRALQAGIFDKYMLAFTSTDAMLTLYNNVSRLLRQRHPASRTLIGGLAYSNVTLPPQSVTRIEPNIVMWLAPIDIDPNHGMDDPKSPPRQEYKGIMYRWGELLEGRLAIYDYDQGQLVWRDMPNPSHQAFVQDVQHYRRAGILGVNTESRGATATTFLNLYLRLQLLWNPDADVDALLADFYPGFYGPAAAPMAEYWNAIFSAWKNTIVTEHEYMVAPAIYTPELVAQLRSRLTAAMQEVQPLRSKSDLTRNEKLYLQRMEFTSLSFAVIENYMAMVQAAARDGEYRAAVAAGDKALAAREQLTAMNPTFTTYKKMGENGYAWMPGEVQQMRELAERVDGSKGSLVARLPLQWRFRPDPRDTGLPRGWAYSPEGPWENLRTDLYMQAQGVRHPDGQSFTGYYWYQTEVELSARDVAADVHLLFPGLFNPGWLYVNGALVARREVREPWWATDYRFEWDVGLAGKLRPGKNLITFRGMNIHHFGGMFRRPFLYRPTALSSRP
jgi:hypothetical protein